MINMEYRGYNLEMLGTFPVFQVKSRGQGPVPKALSGMYTTKTEAIKAVDMYLNSLKKGRSNGKATAPTTN